MFLVYQRISKLNFVGCSCRSIFKETLYKSKQLKRSVVNGFKCPVSNLEKMEFCNVYTNEKLRLSNKRYYFSLKYYANRSFVTSTACNDVNQKRSNSSPIKKVWSESYRNYYFNLVQFMYESETNITGNKRRSWSKKWCWIYIAELAFYVIESRLFQFSRHFCCKI